MTVTPADLGTYLGATVDDTRAQYLIDRATELCLSIVSVNGALPSGSDAVVLDVAGRAYSNPSNANAQAAGPYSATFGAVGGGLWLTRANKTTLRNLAGSGGAFTIDTMPATAGTGLPWWDQSGWGFSDMLPGTWDSPT